MNTVYKMLWIDDSDEFVEMTQELVEDVVRQNNMISKLTIYNTFDEFEREELENFDAEIFNLYDQIIVDYALSETTGDKIIYFFFILFDLFWFFKERTKKQWWTFRWGFLFAKRTTYKFCRQGNKEKSEKRI